jgi:hypothetical protein
MAAQIVFPSSIAGSCPGYQDQSSATVEEGFLGNANEWPCTQIQAPDCRREGLCATLLPPADTFVQHGPSKLGNMPGPATCFGASYPTTWANNNTIPPTPINDQLEMNPMESSPNNSLVMQQQPPQPALSPSLNPSLISALPMQGAGMFVSGPSPISPSSSPEPSPSSRGPEPKRARPSTDATRRTNSFPSPARKGRLPHSAIERRYRDNLNAQLEALRSVLPNLKDLKSPDGDESGKLPITKAVIISAAIKYIEQMHAETMQMNERVGALQQRISGLQKLVKCDVSRVEFPAKMFMGPDYQSRIAPS